MRTRSIRLLSAVALTGWLVAGCYGEVPWPAEGPPTDEAAATATEDDEPAEPLEPVPEVETDDHTWVISHLAFALEESPGVADGFDLDFKVSDGDDEDTCFHADYTSPDGTTGVDNQAQALMPALTLFGGDAVETLVNASIADGEILIILDLDGVEDLTDDPDVTLTVSFAEGKPLVGTDGRLLPAQTFVHDGVAPISTTTEAWISDGVLETGSFLLTMPIVVFNITYMVNLHSARLRATIDPAYGLVDGLIGGGFEADHLYDVALTADADVPEFFFPVIYEVSDMARDDEGVCRQISGALPFEAIPVFVLEE